MIHLFIRWFYQITGSDNGDGFWYLWWSGFFPDIIVFVGLGGWYYHHVCHYPSCRRVAFHKINDTPYTVCRKHHPELPARGEITRAHIREAYNKSIKRR